MLIVGNSYTGAQIKHTYTERGSLMLMSKSMGDDSSGSQRRRIRRRRRKRGRGGAATLVIPPICSAKALNMKKKILPLWPYSRLVPRKKTLREVLNCI